MSASASSSSSSPPSPKARGSVSTSPGRSSRSTAEPFAGRARPGPARPLRRPCRSRGPRMTDQSMLLVADDDPAVRQSLERTLTREGYGVVLAPDGQSALDRLRQGAIDLLTKPLQRAQLLRVVRQALERRSLIQQNRALQRRLDDLLGGGNLIGVSPAWKQMMTLVQQVADSSATVLIQGESGTGKEGVARAIHDGSPRRSGPFVAVNCAALPETLLESELFGYDKGAFTGAAGSKKG